MTVFDGGLLLVFAVSVFFAAVRGGLRELGTLVALAAAGGLGWLIAPRLLGVVGAGDGFLMTVVAMGVLTVVFFVGLYAGLVVLLSRVRLSPQQTLADRIGGGAFGVVRAMALVGLGFLGYAYYLDEDQRPAAVSEALLLPVAQASANLVESFAPERAPALDRPPANARPEPSSTPSSTSSNDSSTARPARSASNLDEGGNGAAAGAAAAGYDRSTRASLEDLVTTVTTTRDAPLAEAPDIVRGDGIAARKPDEDPLASLLEETAR